MKNYLEHDEKVKYVDGLLDHSQQWQWFIDLVHDTFEVEEINSWEDFENSNQPLREVFGYFVKIQEISNGTWTFSKREFNELWDIASYFLGKSTLEECSLKIETTLGKTMLFCTWITKLGNASQPSPTAYIYDIRILNQRNYFQLIDLQPYLMDETALFEYAKTINIAGFDAPLNCLQDNLSRKVYAFDEDFFSQNEEKLLSYNAISFQTIRPQPYATWQELYLYDLVRVSISGRQLQPKYRFQDVVVPDITLWKLEHLSEIKSFFQKKAADFIVDTISFILHGTDLPKETKLTHIKLLSKAIQNGIEKLAALRSSSFEILSLLFEARSLKDCSNESCFKAFLNEFQSITDPVLIIKLKEHSFPISKSQAEILSTYYQLKFKQIDNIEDAYDLNRYLSDSDNPITIDHVHLEAVHDRFNHCIETTEHIIIPNLFYKYMVFLLLVNERNQNITKNWVHSEMIRIQTLWQNTYYELQLQNMHTYSYEQEIPRAETDQLNKVTLANPIVFAQQCIPCSTQKLIEIMQCTAEHALIHEISKTNISRIFPNGCVKVNLARHDIDEMLAKQIETILETKSYKFLNPLSVDCYLLDIHDRYAQYTKFMASLLQRNEDLYNTIQEETCIQLLPYSDTPCLAMLTQLFPILEIKIREFASQFGFFPFKKSLNEFMQYNDPSSLLREILQRIYEEQQSFENVPDLLFVYNVMYNSNSFNIRNECIHGRDFLSGSSLKFAMTVTLLSLHMIIFRINTIRDNVSDILELPTN